jgi:hydrogenase nickel incorporation protein HypA/HybF
MHEEALLRHLLEKVVEVARANGLERVRRVRLWVGAFAHLSEDQLRARWALASAGTVAEGSTLDLEVSDDPTDPRAQEIVLQSLDGSASFAAAGPPGRVGSPSPGS